MKKAWCKTHSHVFVYSFSDNYIASWEFDLDEEFINFLHPLRRCFGQNKTRQSKQVSTASRESINTCAWCCMCYLIDTFLNVNSIPNSRLRAQRRAD
jgi:hypothetical protein